VGAGRDLDIDVGQDGDPTIIGKGGVVEADSAPKDRGRDRIFAIPNVGHPVEDLEHALRRCARAGEPRGVFGEIANRSDRGLEVRQEDHELPGTDLPAHRRPRAEIEHETRRERREHVDRPLEPGR
jgi:hypothetical protein